MRQHGARRHEVPSLRRGTLERCASPSPSFRMGTRLLTMFILAATPAALRAQANVLFSEGIKAYQGLDFAAAAQLLRRALDTDGSLSPADRHRAFMYLGAASVFRDEHSNAVDAFRTLVVADPRFRPDTLIFPPRVTEVYSEVLQTTKAVALLAPAATQFRARDETFTVRAYATSPHQIRARIETRDGALLAELYSGRIADSVTLTWNGLDTAGAVPATGSYRLVVTSLVTPDQALRSVSLPLDVRVEPPDTLPWPAASEVPRSGWDARFLVSGLVLGAGFAVPAALGAGGWRGPRIALGLAFGAAGLIGAARGAGHASPAAEAAWRNRLATVRAENARRREPMITLHTGAPIRTEAGNS
jgi:hypothetical protein